MNIEELKVLPLVDMPLGAKRSIDVTRAKSSRGYRTFILVNGTVYWNSPYVERVIDLDNKVMRGAVARLYGVSGSEVESVRKKRLLALQEVTRRRALENVRRSASHMGYKLIRKDKTREQD